jgi:hypothetical protein
MPQRERDTRSEESPDARLLFAEIEFARLEKDLEDIRWCIHRECFR